MNQIRNNQNLKRKMKGTSLFPKLNKLESSPLQSKQLLNRGIGKKYCGTNIFKLKQQKPHKNIRLVLDDDWIMKSKQYQQLENQFLQLQKKHQQQIRYIEKIKLQKCKDIDRKKKDVYQQKLKLWELKNQVFQLTASLKDQQEQYDKLLNELGYQDGDIQFEVNATTQNNNNDNQSNNQSNNQTNNNNNNIENQTQQNQQYP